MKKLRSLLASMLIGAFALSSVAFAAEPAQGALSLAYNSTTRALSITGLTSDVSVYSLQLDLTLTGAYTLAYVAPTISGLQSKLNQAISGSTTNATLLLDSPSATLNNGTTLALGTLTISNTDLKAITEKIQVKLLADDLSTITVGSISVAATTSDGATGGGSSSGSTTATSYSITVTPATNGTLSASASSAVSGAKVTITTSPNTSYKVEKVQVLTTNNQEITVSKDRENVYSFTMPASKVTVSATYASVDSPAWTNPFADVATTDWYYNSVAFANEQGLFSGTSTTTFSPNSTMTRAMLWTALARLDKQDTAGGDTWYTKAQQWSIGQNLSDGTNPMANITREQLVTILYRFAQMQNIDTTADGAMGLAGFVDSTSISSYAGDAMQWAVHKQLIQGTGDKLNPLGNATRAEVATILMRYADLF